MMARAGFKPTFPLARIAAKGAHLELMSQCVPNAVGSLGRRSGVTHNKQLQRTVTRHRGDGASAPFHYALAPRFARQRAAAELRR
jgi:hypothetical protein